MVDLQEQEYSTSFGLKQATEVTNEMR